MHYLANSSWVLVVPKDKDTKMQDRQTCCNMPTIKLTFRYVPAVIFVQGSIPECVTPKEGEKDKNDNREMTPLE